jgi:hypothetical protein
MADNTVVEAKVVKSGFKSSEFLVTALTVIGSAAASFAGIMDPKIGGILMAISSVAYAISRGLAKGG